MCWPHHSTTLVCVDHTTTLVCIDHTTTLLCTYHSGVSFSSSSRRFQEHKDWQGLIKHQLPTAHLLSSPVVGSASPSSCRGRDKWSPCAQRCVSFRLVSSRPEADQVSKGEQRMHSALRKTPVSSSLHMHAHTFIHSHEHRHTHSYIHSHEHSHTQSHTLT